MDNIGFLIKRDSFTQAEIQEHSNKLWEFLKIDDTTFDLLNKVLFSEAFSSKEDTLAVMKAIEKLKMRQETLELLQSDDLEKALKELKETAERFAQKTKFPIGINRKKAASGI